MRQEFNINRFQQVSWLNVCEIIKNKVQQNKTCKGENGQNNPSFLLLRLKNFAAQVDMVLIRFYKSKHIIINL